MTRLRCATRLWPRRAASWTRESVAGSAQIGGAPPCSLARASRHRRGGLSRARPVCQLASPRARSGGGDGGASAGAVRTSAAAEIAGARRVDDARQLLGAYFANRIDRAFASSERSRRCRRSSRRRTRSFVVASDSKPRDLLPVVNMRRVFLAAFYAVLARRGATWRQPPDASMSSPTRPVRASSWPSRRTRSSKTSLTRARCCTTSTRDAIRPRRSRRAMRRRRRL